MLTTTPKLPPIFHNIQNIRLKNLPDAKESSISSDNYHHALAHTLRTLFPHTFGGKAMAFEKTDKPQPSRPLRVGVVLSGGPAAGGHNVIAGLVEALKQLHPESELMGFRDGPSGIVKNQYIRITPALAQKYRNQGGFDIIGSGRTKIETEAQLEATKNTLVANDLDGLVVIGGDDSNTNAAIIAEYLKGTDCRTAVVGVPKTIDGDMANEHVDISFGFDTACKAYSSEIGSIARDARSAKKYWFFIKMMGRSASHIALECAMQTQPNCALISEEIADHNMTLREVTNYVADIVAVRASHGRNYGVVLIPEGLIEFIPEFKILISHLNKLLANELHVAVLKALKRPDMKVEYVSSLLSGNVKSTYESLPQEFQNQLILERDSHGNVTVSQIETEKLMALMVGAELARRKQQKTYKGEFNTITHFCGYQGRCTYPSAFDATYCYALGYTAASLVNAGLTGYLSCISNLARPVEEWVPKGVPITSMLNIEERHGKQKPVIKKALVNLDGPKFATFVQNRVRWAVEDAYLYPGPVQFFGPPELVETTNHHLRSLL